LNTIQLLKSYGQSLWLDYICRSMFTSGELKRLVDEGISGVTSNPSIFQKAIGEGNDYNSTISEILKKEPGIKTEPLYERLAIEDIRQATDLLRTVYDASGGTDGFVSLEVSPHLAYDTATTIKEAQRLWKAVNRPNLMIKVPATPEGIPAAEVLTAQGINVNVTLIFSLAQYEAVAQAYIRGLEQNPQPQKVSSVASFFVSRIDTAVDKALEKIASPQAMELRGKIAIESCKMVYRKLNEIFYEKPFEKQRSRGGRVQRLVWGSTGTKNPAYSDVLYVDEIIGPDTINTVPVATLDAFRDHGQPQLSLLEGVDEASNEIKQLSGLKIDLTAITNQLLKDGVTAFITSFDQLLKSLEERRKTL
jgi:transaldolase